MAKDYEVGYGKPPERSRFKKGESGNPKGRPKGSRNFSTDVLATLKKPVPVRENGQQKTVSTQEAALLRLREKALGGDPRALDRLLELARIHNDEEMAEAAAAALAPSDQAILDGYAQRLLRRDEDMEPVEDGAPLDDADTAEDDDDAWLN